MTDEPVLDAAPVRVVAAVVRRGARYLVGLRPAHKRHGGTWEFPGGKMRSGEDHLAAARREMTEELSLVVRDVGDLLHSVRDPGSPFVIEFVDVDVDRGAEPVAHEHERVAWRTLAELEAMPLAPADAAFVRWLALNSS